METGKDVSSNIGDNELNISYSMQIETKIKFIGNVKSSDLSGLEPSDFRFSWKEKNEMKDYINCLKQV